MLRPIKHLIDNPQDLPDFSRQLKEQLQAYFDYDFLREYRLLKS